MDNEKEHVDDEGWNWWLEGALGIGCVLFFIALWLGYIPAQ